MSSGKYHSMRDFDYVVERVGEFINRVGSTVSVEIGTVVPRVDMSVTQSAYHLYVELPGVKKDEVKVTVTSDRTLQVIGEKLRPQIESARQVRKERSFGKFKRIIGLPEAIDADTISATFHDGVLEITAPKAAEVHAGDVEVEIS